MKKSVSFLLLLLNVTLLSAQLPPNMYGDSVHTPFYHGVASGDPTTESIVIWTRVSPNPGDTAPISGIWKIALDSLLISPVATGSFAAKASQDWTVKIDVGGLAAGTRYFYRFQLSGGAISAIGRTQTASAGITGRLKFAIASCSSIFSGYFNAYRRIGERNDLAGVIHLGDYIYDFVDENEEVRVPLPYPTVPQNLLEWRQRHAYYLLDPDLRYARQQHPWIPIWDNHDLQTGDGESALLASIQAFEEWLPIRIPDTLQPQKIYRRLQFGDLVDILLMDIRLFRNTDTLSSGEYSIIGNEQFDWITENFVISGSRWHIIGSQKMFGGWYTVNIPDFIQAIIPTDGDVFDAGSWDGFPADRSRLLSFLQDNDIDNNIIISGDSHFSMAVDLTTTPFDTTSYNPETGEGAIGVEFLPTSITRGNFDEEGVPALLSDIFIDISHASNPHHIYNEFTKHGYGLLDISLDSITAQFLYSEILAISAMETLGKQLVVRNGENHWVRPLHSSTETNDDVLPILFQLFPNPTRGQLFIGLPSEMRHATISLYNAQGVFLQQKIAKSKTHLIFDVALLPVGAYFVVINNGHVFQSRVFIKE